MASAALLLVVDDSEADRTLMAHILRSAFPAAEVRSCGRPMEVEQLCTEQQFDCVFLDYYMPELDGMALAGRLRAADAYLPIVLTTGVGDEMLVTEALRGGASDYIPKGRVTVESVERTIQRSIRACAQARIIDDQRAELENFAFALAHDFKQPLRQIMTFSSLISDALSTSETGILQHLTFMSDAANRLARLVDVMSQYTLLNEPIEREAVALSRVIAAVRMSLSTYLEERAGELVSPGVLPVVSGSETLLIQILENLITNGLKYNRSASPRVEVTAARQDEHWLLEVRDNGIGIEPEYLSEVFDPLIRLHTSAQYPGSGLGLAIARKAVLALGGEIWCESKLGEGSVFRVRLPRSERLVTA